MVKALDYRSDEDLSDSRHGQVFFLMMMVERRAAAQASAKRNR